MKPHELAILFLDGDNRAFEVIYAEHNRRLFAYCLKLVKDRATAEDLVQETWVRTIGLRTRKGDKIGNLYGMIYRIARNLSLDHLKSYRQTNRVLLEDGERQMPTSVIPEPTEQEELVLRALDKLPFDYREVILLHTYSGYAYEEIAEMLGKSAEAIWTRASRARKRLRSLVAEEMRQEEKALRLLDSDKKVTRRRFNEGMTG